MSFRYSTYGATPDHEVELVRVAVADGQGLVARIGSACRIARGSKGLCMARLVVAGSVTQELWCHSQLCAVPAV